MGIETWNLESGKQELQQKEMGRDSLMDTVGRRDAESYARRQSAVRRASIMP